MNEANEILLNIMFTGTYLKDDNIGHEAINLFKDDNGNNYIYVLPYGTMDQKHNDKIKSILLIRRHNSKVFEIFAKAEDIKQIARVETTRNKDMDKLLKEQLEFIESNNITYNGVRVDNIFSENNNRGIQTAYITFSAKKVTKTKQPIYIIVDSDKQEEDTDNYKILNGIYNFSSQSPKMYISETENVEAYRKLEKIIANDNYWKEETQKLTNYSEEQYSDLNSFNFIDIIRKNHDELCYSNLLQHFFAIKPNIFKKFAKELLDVSDFSENYNILREWNNIDILIDDYENKNVIVIENKIKSGINGVVIENNKQSDKNKDNTKQVEKQSQLADYYNLIVHGDKNYDDQKAKSVKNDNINKENSKYVEYKVKKFFIFYPDYSSINIEEYKYGKKYKPIKYSEVFNFFDKYKDEFKEITYFEEFLYALQKHTRPVDNSNEEEMLKKFMAKIKSKKAK